MTISYAPSVTSHTAEHTCPYDSIQLRLIQIHFRCSCLLGFLNRSSKWEMKSDTERNAICFNTSITTYVPAVSLEKNERM
jgi:hypothetical protein